MAQFYLLDEDHNLIPCNEPFLWAMSMEKLNVTVGRDEIHGFEVITSFLGINHEFREGKPPILFETMIFGPDANSIAMRGSTWDDAELMHRKVVDWLRASCKEADNKAQAAIQTAKGGA